MKQFNYNGQIITASSKNEAIQKIVATRTDTKFEHKAISDKRVSPYKAMRGKTAEELLGNKNSIKIEWLDGDNDMICPFCGQENASVESGMDGEDYRYSYECEKCGHKWDSFYSMTPSEIWIRK